MKKIFQAALFALAFAASAFAGATDLGQVIHIDVDSAGKTVVEGKPVPAPTLSATLSGMVQDKEHAAIELKVPDNLDPAALEQIKNACRKAGISRFSLVSKPAPKAR